MPSKKPTGSTGPVRMTTTPQGSTVEYQQLPFPREKDDIEKVIVEGFLKSAFPSTTVQPSKNPQDHFDFSLSSPSGEKHLELMEIAPLEHLRGSYESAPDSYRPYDFADYIVRKLQGKSTKYAGSTAKGLILLLYVTDWRFILSMTVIALLQYWTQKTPHNFEAIYAYHPITPSEGIGQVIFPTPAQHWQNFDPEQYRDNVVTNFDPTGWVVGSTSPGPGE